MWKIMLLLWLFGFRVPCSGIYLYGISYFSAATRRFMFSDPPGPYLDISLAVYCALLWGPGDCILFPSDPCCIRISVPWVYHHTTRINIVYLRLYQQIYFHLCTLRRYINAINFWLPINQPKNTIFLCASYWSKKRNCNSILQFREDIFSVPAFKIVAIVYYFSCGLN